MLKVADVMTTHPFAVTADTLLQEAFALMIREGFRQLPVVEGQRLVGILTDRDVRTAINSPQYRQLRVGQIMSVAPITVAPELPAYRAAEMLSLYKIGALPVMDRGQLIGIITISDFLAYFAARHHGEGYLGEWNHDSLAPAAAQPGNGPCVAYS